MKYAAALLCALVASSGLAGEPRVPLEKWTTNDGKTAEAAFQSIDEAAGTVTILVPRTIELSRLDADSLARLRGRTESEVDPLAIGMKDAVLREWVKADEPLRVATISNMVFELMASRAFVDQIRGEVGSPRGFNNYSRKLAKSVADLVGGASEEELASKKVVDLAYSLLVASGHIRKAGDR